MLTAGVSAELLPAGGGAPARGTRLARAPQQRPSLEGPGRGADAGRVAVLLSDRPVAPQGARRVRRSGRACLLPCHAASLHAGSPR